MAQRVEIIIEDDLDGSEDAHTVTFALDGATYEIDLSEDHSDQLRTTLASWIAAGRKIGGRRATGPKTAQAPIDREQLDAVREWGRANGYTVSDRGRVSATVQQAFQQAHL